MNQGSDEHAKVLCRLVAQDLGYGQRLDELFAGTPSLSIVKLLLSYVAEYDQAVMLLDV